MFENEISHILTGSPPEGICTQAGSRMVTLGVAARWSPCAPGSADCAAIGVIDVHVLLASRQNAHSEVVFRGPIQSVLVAHRGDGPRASEKVDLVL